MKFAGIDVGKASLHLAILEPAHEGEFQNTPAGHKKLTKRLSELGEPVRVVVEATATYSEGIARALADATNIEVMIANPRSTKAFAKALNQRGKTDTLDRQMLARFAAAMPFTAWTPPSDTAHNLRRMMRRRLQLVRQLAEEKVRLKEMKLEVAPDAFVVEDIEHHLAHLTTRIKRIEQRALEFVQADDELERWRGQLCTVPGIANVTALAVMAELACLPTDMDVRQLVAYAGLDPQPFQSGTMDARRRISKRGNKRLRTTLYLAAWNTTRFSTDVRAWRDRLIDRGKPPKLADIAVARKLLHAIAGMRKTNTDWDGARFNPGTSMEVSGA